jgi:hypothetical protein
MATGTMTQQTRENFCPAACDWIWGQPFTGHWGAFPPSIQQAGSEADLSHLHVVAWCIIKHRDKFT